MNDNCKNSQHRHFVSVSYSSKNSWIIELLPEFSKKISSNTSDELIHILENFTFELFTVLRLRYSLMAWGQLT